MTGTIAFASGQTFPAEAFPAGTAMLFVQSTAPVGWTKSTVHNDKALRIVNGTASSGGTLAFSSAFASRTSSGTVGNHTLTINQIPSHTHSYTEFRDIGSILNGPIQYRTFNNTGAGQGSSTTAATGGGLAHNHTYSITTDFAVQYVDVIIATKD